jgi:hypothetical protein
VLLLEVPPRLNQQDALLLQLGTLQHNKRLFVDETSAFEIANLHFELGERNPHAHVFRAIQ